MKVWAAAMLAILLICMTAACSEESPTRVELEEQVDQLESEKAELQGKVDQLTEQLDTARDTVSRVSAAASDVQDAASRFNGENWRDVVPDVQSASDDLDTAKTKAEEAVEEE